MFQNIVYELIYAQEVVIICFYMYWSTTSPCSMRQNAVGTEPRKFNSRKVLKEVFWLCT